MPATTVFYRVEGSETKEDETEVKNWKEIIATLKDFYREAEAASEEDGEPREVGIIVKGGGPDEDDKEGEEEDQDENLPL